MFNWFRRYYNNRRRALFRYWDGVRWRQADPLVILRCIVQHPKLTPDHLSILESPDGLSQELALDAFDTVIGAARDVFQVGAWSESRNGLTQAETRDLLSRFLNFVNLLKKSGSPTQTSLEPTEPTASIDNSQAESMKSSSGLHSMHSAQRPDDLPGCC